VSSIHPTAVVSPQAELGSGVRIGPFCVVHKGVTIAADSELLSHAVIHPGVTMGEGNRVHEGAVIGGTPQHIKAQPPLGDLVIGNGNIFREHCTLHVALEPGKQTVIGNHNFLMVNTHVGHDCRVADHTIMANNVMLSGHVTIEDRAFLSGAVGVHQHCRVGRNAMVGGQSAVKQDVLPFVTVDGMSNKVVGLNTIGLRRAGYTASDLRQLKQVYRLIFRSGLPRREILERLARDFSTGPAAHCLAFMQSNPRGLLQERRGPVGGTVKFDVVNDTEPAPQPTRKAV